MKWTFFYKQNYKIALSILFLMMIYNVATAANGMNYIIISGQVTNLDYGSPVKGRTIYIATDSTQCGSFYYSNTLITNNEGYYCDTISTFSDKGSLIVYTYDYFGKSIDTTVHFRFLERGESVILANFAFNFPYQPAKVQARFSYVQQSGNNRNKFSFFDQTKNDHIVSWHWDFGDGTTSTLQTPTHEYQSFGLFKVIFTVTTNFNNVLETSIITKQLYINSKEFYHLGGHVFSEYFPIDVGYAYLYMIDSLENYITIDTIAFDTLGYYYFYHIPKGNYLVKVEPTRESEYYGTLLPTYYGNKLFWDEAHIIDLTGTCWEYDIHMANSENLSTGEGVVSGNIEYVDDPRTPINFSANGVNIYLFDDDNILTCHYTDNSGNFIFDLLEIKSYWLYPEITGIQAEKIRIDLTLEIPEISNIEISIQSGSINFIIPNDGDFQNEAVGTPYPNPVSGTLNIPLLTSFGKHISYVIYDMYGHKIISNPVDMIIGSNNYQISTVGIRNGTYVLRTIVDKTTYDRIFIVAR